MCGIWGILGAEIQRVKKDIFSFSDKLSQRGPDDKGHYIDATNCVILGHTRLSIIDLSQNAHQPMQDPSGNFILVFNGEIYNYRELKTELEEQGCIFKTESDTEVVLYSYITWGEKCVTRFRGMFAFCIYNKKNKRLFLTRDRFGIKPIIYSFLNNQFMFTSELKPILHSNLLPKRLCLESVSELFQYGSVRQPKTILEGIYHLMPGHTLTVEKNRQYKIRPYYNLIQQSKVRPQINNYNEAVNRVREELELATQYHMIADVNVGAFLSGGVDSTAAVALMQQYADQPINTFCVGFSHKENVPDETDVAARSARALGTKHRTIKINDQYIDNIIDDFIACLDQPSIDGINTYIVSREAAKELNVAISGLGGDELFAGYRHFSLISANSHRQPSRLNNIGKWANNIKPNRFTNHCNFMGVKAETALNRQRSISNLPIEDILIRSLPIQAVKKYSGLSPIQKVTMGEFDNYLLSTLLRDCDVLSMANSMEIRPILLDHKLVELAFSLKDIFKIREGRLKSVFVDAVKDLIPTEVWSRKKTGFEMPFSHWLNGKLNTRFSTIAHNSMAKRHFNNRYLKTLQHRIERCALTPTDWMSFVFLSWLDLYQIDF